MTEEMEDDAGFPNEDVQRCISEAQEAVLESAQWDEEKVPLWINEIVERCMKGLSEIKSPYKYIVTCMIV